MNHLRNTFAATCWHLQRRVELKKMYKAFSINISYKANTKTRQKQKCRPKDWGKDKDKKWRPIEGCYELCRTAVEMSCVIGINAKNITWITGVFFYCWRRRKRNKWKNIALIVGVCFNFWRRRRRNTHWISLLRKCGQFVETRPFCAECRLATDFHSKLSQIFLNIQFLCNRQWNITIWGWICNS